MITKFILQLGFLALALAALPRAASALAIDAASPQASCAHCTASQLLSKLHGLQYSQLADRRAGRRLAKQVAAAAEGASATDVAAFPSLLGLAREAEPYDGEGRIASALAKLMGANPQLAASYASFLGQQPIAEAADQCKNKQLKSALNQALCQAAKGIDAASCVDSFNYQSCLAL